MTEPVDETAYRGSPTADPERPAEILEPWADAPGEKSSAADDHSVDGQLLDHRSVDDRSVDDRLDDDRWVDDRLDDDRSDDDRLDEPSDWAWVEEWRSGGEPVPWGPGLGLAGFTTMLVASAVYVLSAGLSDRPIVAIGVNVLVAGGLAPALWLSRQLPVLRWVAGGAVVGVLMAWLSVLVFLV